MEASVVVCSTTKNRCITGVGPWAATFLFVYCAPLHSYPCSRNGLPPLHQYAEDTQVYIAVSKSDFQLKLNQFSVHAWLQMNGLQLNPNKSEVIQFTAIRGRDRVEDVTSLQVSNAAIKPSSTIKCLGVTRDTKLSFDEHVTNVCRLCYRHIRALRHVRASLPKPSPAAP